MQSSDLDLSPDAWDASWGSLPEAKENKGLLKSQPYNREYWVVRLRFKLEGEVKSGTGFFLNVPASKWYLILTAAHNLVDEDGNASENLHVGSRAQPGAPLNIHSVNICPEYRPSRIKGKPKGSTADIDYGLILVSRGPDSPNIGFGFALNLSQDDLYDVPLELSGYIPREEKPNETQASTTEPYLDARSGRCRVSSEGFLEYDMDTTPGLSGAPIYMPYKGFDTVVAVHNNGSASADGGSRGARLSCRTMQQIFEWAQLIARDKALRSEELPAANHMYLQFLAEEAYAQVHMSKKDMSTCFDVFPAYAAPSSIDNHMLWVFRIHHPRSATESTQRWVLWNIAKKRVSLTKSLQEYCFARLVTDTTKPSIPNVFWVVLVNPNRTGGKLQSLWNLSMDSTCVPELDLKMGKLHGPGISFSKHMMGKNRSRTQFYRFLLE